MLQLTTIIFLLAFFTLALIHNIAIQLFLYWGISWFDMPVHLLGGAVVALGFFALRDLRLFPNSLLKPVPVLFLVFLIAIVWEVFEVAIGIPMFDDHAFDTFTDILMGMIGGWVGYIVGSNLRKLR